MVCDHETILTCQMARQRAVLMVAMALYLRYCLPLPPSKQSQYLEQTVKQYMIWIDRKIFLNDYDHAVVGEQLVWSYVLVIKLAYH